MLTIDPSSEEKLFQNLGTSENHVDERAYFSWL